MSYDLIETSVDDARPIELFEIAYTGNRWRYTSADRDITYLGNVYRAVACSRSDLEPTSDSTKASLNLTFPRDVELSDVFRIQPPSEVVSVTLFGEHFEDNDFIVFWKGRIINAEWKGSVVEFVSESIFSSMRRPGLRRRYQLQCPYALYGAKCGVNRDSWKEEHLLTHMSGLSLQFNSTIGKPAGYYAGGYLTWENSFNQNIEKRMIRSFDTITGTVVLSAAPIGLSQGQLLTMYPGCNHTLDGGGCARFNNTDNFGGTPFIPMKNPFGGTSIF